MRRRFGAEPRRVDRVALAVDDVIVDPVLEICPAPRMPEQPPHIGFVVAEQQFAARRRRSAASAAVADDRPRSQSSPRAASRGFIDIRLPRPGVARPELRQDMQDAGSAAAIVDRHLHQNVVGRGLGVFDLDIEIAVARRRSPVSISSNSGSLRAAPPVLLDQLRVRESGLRIFVEHPHVGVGRRAVEVVVELLDVLAVIALAVGQAEQALLEDRVLAVPQRERQAEQQLVVAKARRSRPRPSDRRGCARGRAENSPRQCRRGCSPRAPCPIAAR